MPFNEIDFEDLEFHEQCGKGAHSTVYRAIWRSKGRVVAVKMLIDYEDEIELLSGLSHRNIIQFYGAITQMPNYCVVTEYWSNGSLYSYLRRLGTQVRSDRLRRWAKEIATGINYLHIGAPYRVIHKDLKSLNVALSSNWTCKLWDFGVAKFDDPSHLMPNKDTFPWMAPEVIHNLPITEKSDAWSYGVVLWELCTGQVPHDGLSLASVIRNITEGEKLVIPPGCPYKDLLNACWDMDPEGRPSFVEILTQLDNINGDNNQPGQAERDVGGAAAGNFENEEEESGEQDLGSTMESGLKAVSKARNKETANNFVLTYLFTEGYETLRRIDVDDKATLESVTILCQYCDTTELEISVNPHGKKVWATDEVMMGWLLETDLTKIRVLRIYNLVLNNEVWKTMGEKLQVSELWVVGCPLSVQILEALIDSSLIQNLTFLRIRGGKMAKTDMDRIVCERTDLKVRKAPAKGVCLYTKDE